MTGHVTATSSVDAAWTLDLLRRAVRTPSVTGEEAAFGALLAGELAALGADVRAEEVAPGRPVVTGVLRGGGTGPTLMLVGHLDVVRTEGWGAAWPEGDPRADPFAAAEADDAVWGRGAVDVKGGIAAALGAVRAVRDTDGPGAQAGDLVCAFVCDEESGEPGLGRSLGMAHVAAAVAAGRLPQPDAAVYVEPTGLDVLTAQIGFLVAEVELTGRTAYFARPGEGADAGRAAGAVLAALHARADALAAGPEHPLCGRPVLVVHRVDVGAGTIAVPGDARLELIRTVLPGEDLGAAATELEDLVADAVAGTGVEAAVGFPAGRDHAVGGLPFEADPEAPPLAALRAHVAARAAGRGVVRGAAFWSELSFLDALGVPSAYFGPGDITRAHTPAEHVPTRAVLLAAAALADLLSDLPAPAPQGAQP